MHCRALPYRRVEPPVGAPDCPFGWLFTIGQLLCRTAGYRRRAAAPPSLSFVKPQRLRLNKFSSLGALPSYADASDGGSAASLSEAACRSSRAYAASSRHALTAFGRAARFARRLRSLRSRLQSPTIPLPHFHFFST